MQDSPRSSGASASRLRLILTMTTSMVLQPPSDHKKKDALNRMLNRFRLKSTPSKLQVINRTVLYRGLSRLRVRSCPTFCFRFLMFKDLNAALNRSSASFTSLPPPAPALAAVRRRRLPPPPRSPAQQRSVRCMLPVVQAFKLAVQVHTEGGAVPGSGKAPMPSSPENRADGYMEKEGQNCSLCRAHSHWT